jgi:hypothetical protein
VALGATFFVDLTSIQYNMPYAQVLLWHTMKQILYKSPFITNQSLPSPSKLLSQESNMIRADGIRRWYQNDQLHRLDGPAVIRADGHQEWWQNDQLHRLDGPAVIGTDGYQAWYQNHQLHRLDGPAVIAADGIRRWYQNHQLHRLDGPAVIWPDGSQEWHINGIDLTNEINKWMQDNHITWPWDSATQLQFVLTWS